MVDTRVQTSRLCITLKSGEICRALVRYADDGQLSIQCTQAVPPPVYLRPGCDLWTVEDRAQVILTRSLADLGLL